MFCVNVLEQSYGSFGMVPGTSTVPYSPRKNLFDMNRAYVLMQVCTYVSMYGCNIARYINNYFENHFDLTSV